MGLGPGAVGNGNCSPALEAIGKSHPKHGIFVCFVRGKMQFLVVGKCSSGCGMLLGWRGYLPPVALSAALCHVRRVAVTIGNDVVLRNGTKPCKTDGWAL